MPWYAWPLMSILLSAALRDSGVPVLATVAVAWPVGWGLAWAAWRLGSRKAGGAVTFHDATEERARDLDDPGLAAQVRLVREEMRQADDKAGGES